MNQLSRVYIDTQVMASIGDACAQFGKAYKAQLQAEVSGGYTCPIFYSLTITGRRKGKGLSVSTPAKGWDGSSGCILKKDEEAIDARVWAHQDVLYAELKKFLVPIIRSQKKRGLLTEERLREILSGYDLLLLRSPTEHMGPNWRWWERWLWQTTLRNFGYSGIIVTIPLPPIIRFGQI